jgi:PGF-pre-PGF domain-containing protein
MNVRLQIFMAIIVSVLLAGNAGAAAITFDKSLDVPDRTFTWENNNYTITHIGNYKLNDIINVGITSGTDTMLVSLYDADKLSVWHETKFNTGGQTSVSIPADTVIAPGIYGIVVSSKPDAIIIGANPLIISEYDMTVTPGSTQASPGSVIKVTVAVSKNGYPISVVPNNVNVTFVQDSTSTHFEGTTAATAITGTYEANIQIPSGASGSYRLYAAITTNRNIYQNYPELIGAASYSGTIEIPTPSQTSTTSSGGGGGGGGGLSGEEFINIAATERYEKFISKDAPVSYNFRTPDNPINEIVITSNINAGDTTVMTEILRGTSSQISISPPGIVYKNINIIVGGPGFAVPKNIKEAVIKFRVENSWIASNNLASSDINMVKWDGSKWAQIDTSEMNKNATYTYYEAKTDSFSAFAITGFKGVVTPTAAPEGTVTETPLKPTATPTAPIPAQKVIPGFEGIMAIVAVALLVALLKNDRKGR